MDYAVPRGTPLQPAGLAPSSDPVPRHLIQQEAERRLVAGDHRPSRNRRLLVWGLADADRPRSVSELLENHAGVPQSSVYRNLRVLERVGVVVSVATGDSIRWELDESLTHRHHHCLLCRECGVVATYEPSADLEAGVRSALSLVAASHGFDADGHRLDLVGRCRDRCSGV